MECQSFCRKTYRQKIRYPGLEDRGLVFAPNGTANQVIGLSKSDVVDYS
jgi:hypothetical protein